jgi:hypothetical protein
VTVALDVGKLVRTLVSPGSPAEHARTATLSDRLLVASWLGLILGLGLLLVGVERLASAFVVAAMLCIGGCLVLRAAGMRAWHGSHTGKSASKMASGVFLLGAGLILFALGLVLPNALVVVVTSTELLFAVLGSLATLIWR